MKRRRHRIVLMDGQPLVVIRPKDPALALQLAKVALETQDADLMARLPSEAGEYTFQGYLAEGRKPIIVDKEGYEVGRCQPGDSFVTLKEGPSWVIPKPFAVPGSK